MAGTGGPSCERLCGAAAAAAGYGWEAPGLGKGGAVDGPGGEWKDAAPGAGHPGALVVGRLGGLGVVRLGRSLMFVFLLDMSMFFLEQLPSGYLT